MIRRSSELLAHLTFFNLRIVIGSCFAVFYSASILSPQAAESVLETTPTDGFAFPKPTTLEELSKEVGVDLENFGASQKQNADVRGIPGMIFCEIHQAYEAASVSRLERMESIRSNLLRRKFAR